jgi:hypothetical protein
MEATIDQIPTTEQLLSAVEELVDAGLLQSFNSQSSEEGDVWEITSGLKAYEGHTRQFVIPAEKEALDKHLKRTYDKVALFRPIFWVESSGKRAVVRRDTTFSKRWMVSRRRGIGRDTYYEGCVLFDKRREAKAYAEAWAEKETSFYSKEDFRSESDF